MAVFFDVSESNRTIRDPKDDDFRPELMWLNHTHPNRGQPCFWSKSSDFFVSCKDIVHHS